MKPLDLLENISDIPEKHHNVSYVFPDEGERVLALYHGEWIVLEVGVEIPSYEESFEPFKYWFEPFNNMLCIEYYDVDMWVPLPEIPIEEGAQCFLEQRINNLAVECDSRLKQIAYQDEQISNLKEHIQNLQKASQDYCMCGMRLGTNGIGCCGHPISEFDWYCKEHNL